MFINDLGLLYDEAAILNELMVGHRIAYEQEITQQNQQLASAQEKQAEIVGYNPGSGLYIVKLLNGQTAFATAITNGSISISDQVSFTNASGPVGIIDAMPK